jgi:hypothetical protein
VKSAVRRRVIFAAVAVAAAGVAAFAVLLAVDVYLHGRYERSAGFNVWGYRGATVGKKQPNEYRIVVLGGSAAYGYGVNAEQAMPAVLEARLRASISSPLFTVVNLGYNNEGVYSFKSTLEDYDWLNYDLALLYEGYNDLVADEPNLQVFRHASPVFRLTGYMPIFPIIFNEKAGAMLNGGDVGARYRPDNKTVFYASVPTKAAAGVLQATASVAQSLETQLGKVVVEPVHRIAGPESRGCQSPWQNYCRSIAAAVDYARGRSRQVLVVTQPYLRLDPTVHTRHLSQQEALRASLAPRLHADPAVGYANLGDAVDLENRELSFDHMHLTVAGNDQLARALVQPVLAMAARAKATAP